MVAASMIDSLGLVGNVVRRGALQPCIVGFVERGVVTQKYVGKGWKAERCTRRRGMADKLAPSCVSRCPRIARHCGEPSLRTHTGSAILFVFSPLNHLGGEPHAFHQAVVFT